jgi:putative transcriptional regulator
MRPKSKAFLMDTTKKNNLFTSLTGKILLAMPGMGDPRFHHAVIFMCAHDANGAMGLVINHTLPGMEFRDLLEQLKIASDIRVDINALRIPVLSGGPVEGARGFLLHSSEFKQPDTVSIDPHYSITGTTDALRDVAAGKGPQRLLFILGYAGWGAGQLEAEIQENAWLVMEADPEIIFNAPADDKWQRAFEKLGFDPGRLSQAAGRA